MAEPGPPKFPRFTPSCTMPFNKNLCFFCQEDNDEKLIKLCTEIAGEALKSAVENSQNPEFKVRLNPIFSPTDAQAMEVKYHKSCWTKHVFHPTRYQDVAKRTSRVNPLQNVCLIELINCVDLQTKNKAFLSMDDIEATYMSMIGEEGMANHFPAFTRQWLKDKICTELPSVKSVLQKDRRKSAVVYSPDACNEDMLHSVIKGDYDLNDMKTIFKAAQIIRKTMSDFKRVKTENVIPVSSNIDDVPTELYSMIHWLIVGSVNELKTDRRTTDVDRIALTVSQNILYGFKSNRQAKYKPIRDRATFRHPREKETPRVLGLALTVHHDTRNK